MRIRKILAAIVLSALTAFAAGQAPKATAFCDKLKALTADPAVAAAHWGVSVMTLSGTVLCGVNPAQLFRPASNNKLFTTAAALALLGPEHRFTTTVQSSGDLASGVLQGDLRLVGAGDPSFGTHDVPFLPPAQRPHPSPPEPPTIADIEQLADQIAARGIRTVQGNIIGDDSYFAWEPYPTGWEVEDLNTDFGAPVSALTIHDNTQEIDLSPAPDSAPPTISMLPAVPFYTVQSAGMVTGPAEPAPAHAHYSLDRALGSAVIDLQGWIPVNAPVVKVQTAIDNPAQYAALALKQALERRGVTITGMASVIHGSLLAPSTIAARNAHDAAIERTIHDLLAPTTAATLIKPCPATPSGTTGPTTVLATHQSPRLADDVTYTLKESQNLHAEILLHQLGSAFACDTMRGSSLTVLRAYLREIGIAPTDLVLYDGSGLSGHDLVTPRSLTQLLVFAAGQKWFSAFKSALPVGGSDGTLTSRFAPPDSKLQGRVFAKTGTLGESRDLSGYVTAASGATMVFSIMADNHRPDSTADRTAMDKIVELIAASN